MRGAAKGGPQKPIVETNHGSQGAPTTAQSPYVFPGFRPHTPHVKDLPGGPPPPSNQLITDNQLD